MNLNNVNVPSTLTEHQYTTKDVKSAILTAAKHRGWRAKIIKPGLILATISRRTHCATVEILYTQSNYSIDYKDSKNLDYNGTNKIHRNYNNWVMNLSRSIQRELDLINYKY